MSVRNTVEVVEASSPIAQKVCPACNSRYGDEVGFCSRDGTPLVADPNAGKADLAGQVLADRYRIVKLLGEGGMGQVYEAQHVNINKRFAIKLLRPEIVANAEAVARFRQEAWSASSIGHENIVEIDDFATLPNGSVYLAMEFLKGRALSDRMRLSPPLELAEALDILLQVCRGLEAAHQKGIVHRDMKPENVFLAEKHGRVIAKILDFGIAKVSGAEGSQSLTRTGTIFGTPHYMSPEQALGRPLDHRADIYSVGVIMYEAMTGRVPFEAESFMGILTKHITVQPVPPREAAPERNIAPEIEAVILRAMAKEATDRYQSMSEVVAELSAVAHKLAPQVLTLPSGSISAQFSAQMPALTGSAMRAVVGPPAGTPAGMSAVAGSAGTAQRSAVANKSTPEIEAPARSSKTGLWIGLTVALAGVGAAGFVVFNKPPPPPATPPVTVEPTPPPVAAPTPPPVEHAASKDLIVLVDSDPAGAQILIGDTLIGDAPRNITLTDGKPKTLMLRKHGYVEQTLTLDSASDSRRIVRLVKIPTKETKPAAKAPPAKPTAPAAAPPLVSAPKTPVGARAQVAAPPTSPPPPGPRNLGAKKAAARDPYERVDEHKKSSDIINPY